MRFTHFAILAITFALCVEDGLAQSRDGEKLPQALFGEPRPKFTSTMEAVEYFRKKNGLTREELLSPTFQNGVGFVKGKTMVTPHVLDHLSKDIPAKSLRSQLVLMAYLKDKSLRVRCLAAFALNRVLQAYPKGMSLSDVSDMESAGHRKMVKLFADRIAKRVIKDR